MEDPDCCRPRITTWSFTVRMRLNRILECTTSGKVRQRAVLGRHRVVDATAWPDPALSRWRARITAALQTRGTKSLRSRALPCACYRRWIDPRTGIGSKRRRAFAWLHGRLLMVKFRGSSRRWLREKFRNKHLVLTQGHEHPTNFTPCCSGISQPWHVKVHEAYAGGP